MELGQSLSFVKMSGVDGIGGKDQSIRREERWSHVISVAYNNYNDDDESANDRIWRYRCDLFLHLTKRWGQCQLRCKIQLRISQAKWNSLQISKFGHHPGWRPDALLNGSEQASNEEFDCEYS